jgi:hypothetical protein
MSASAGTRESRTQDGTVHELALRAAAVSIFIALFIEFYWTTLRSKFRLLSGDEGDAMFVAALHDHVYQSLLGHASLRNPPFFFPAQGVLGYSDAFLLNQIFFAPLRALGVEQLLAVQLTWMILSVMGGIAFALLLNRFFLVRAWLAILSGGIFAFGHTLYMKMIHSQHLAIHFLPIVGLLALSATLRERSPARTAALAFAAGLLFGLTFTTGFYMAWFFTFFLLLALPVFAFLYWTTIAAYVRAHSRRLLVASMAGVVGFAIGAGVLFSIYGPAIAALGGTSADRYLVTAAGVRDIINVSDGNLVWGALLRATQLIPLHRLQMTESHLAVTPLLVLATVTATMLLLRNRQSSEYGQMAAALCVAILFGYAALYVLTVSFRGTTSLFLMVQEIVPGAIAIRAGFRSQVLSAMFISMALAVAAEAYLRRAEKHGLARARDVHSLAILFAGAVLALEQVDHKPLARADREREIAIMTSALRPPASCRVFAIYDDMSHTLPAIQIEAVRLSQQFDIPTVNGYSGGNPPGWDLADVWKPNYIDKVKIWARDKAIAGPLCLYDAAAKSWYEIGSAPF